MEIKMDPERAKKLEERIDEVEHSVDQARADIRVLRYALALQQDPEFKRMMDLADNPETGTSGENFLERFK